MKKTLFTSMVILLLLLLTACGTKSNGSKQAEDENTNANDQPTEENNLPEEEEALIVYPQLTTEVASNEALVIMNTTLGPIKIKLFPELAPKTVANFLTHAENGYYDGIIFHRVMDDFMIQGGDPTGTGMGGESIFGGSFEDEFTMNLFNLRGALSMANAGPNTNGSQFFIVQKPAIDPGTADALKNAGFPEEIIEAYEKMGGTPHLDHMHTVFGQVIEGMDTVDKIAKVEAVQTKPVEDVKIESIEIIQK